MKDNMTDETNIERSSGNVFADISLPNPDEHLAKANIALTIAEIIRARGLTQEEAGKILRLSQPKVSDLVRGKLDKFTTDRLLRYATKLNYNVIITLQPNPKKQEEATIRVNIAG